MEGVYIMITIWRGYGQPTETPSLWINRIGVGCVVEKKGTYFQRKDGT